MTDTVQEEKKRYREVLFDYFKVHFAAIMILVASLSAAFVVIGKYMDNDIVVSLSTAAFSASTLGAVFKFLGFDVFIITILRQIVYERRFLELFHEDELRRVIRETIAVLRRGNPRDEMYLIFEKYLLEDLVGVVNDNRMIQIDLVKSNELGPSLIRGKTSVAYDVRNESPRPQPLFLVEGENDVIWKGTATIPEPLKRVGIPADHDLLWNLHKDNQRETGVCVAGEWVYPTVEKDWLDPGNHEEGVKYRVKYCSTIIPNDTKHIELKNFCIFDTRDYIVRKFSSYGKDVEIVITKPKDITVLVSWFLTARGKKPEAQILSAQRSLTMYLQRVEGYIVPGNGFVVMWWPTRVSRTA